MGSTYQHDGETSDEWIVFQALLLVVQAKVAIHDDAIGNKQNAHHQRHSAEFSVVALRVN